jgi:hypothetical protein
MIGEAGELLLTDCTSIGFCHPVGPGTQVYPSIRGLIKEIIGDDEADFKSLVATRWNDQKWVKLGNKAFSKDIRPTLSSDDSLVNFLIELKDLITMGKYLRSRRGLLAKLGNSALGGCLFKQLLAEGAQLFLTWAYGILPLVRDLYTFSTKFVNFVKSADRLVAQAGQLLSSHSAIEVADSSLWLPYGDPIQVHREGIPIWLYREFKWEPETYHATAQYSYRVPELQAVIARLRQFLSLIGLNLDPSIIWNAIPYSFVFDWFVNVGDYLHSLRVDAYEVEVLMSDYCHSVKCGLVVRTYASGHTPTVDPSNPLNLTVQDAKTLLDEATYRAYGRVRFKPSAANVQLKSKTLTPMHFALGVALLATRYDYQPRFVGS